VRAAIQRQFKFAWREFTPDGSAALQHSAFWFGFLGGDAMELPPSTIDEKVSELIVRYGDSVKVRQSNASLVYFGVALEFAAFFIVFFGLALGFAAILFLADPGKSSTAYGASGLIVVIWAVGGLIAYPMLRFSAICLAAHDTRMTVSRSASTILYLRPFSADRETAENILSALGRSVSGILTTSLLTREPFKSTGLSDTAWNVETLLRQVMSSWNVVAIGRPEETLQKPGAARLYVDDEHWTSLVSELMALSQVVILRLNGPRTRGIAWELETLRKLNFFQKVIILTLDDTNNPLEFGIISPILGASGIDISSAKIPSYQRQQAIYYANDQWRSSSADAVKNPLGNLSIVLYRLLAEHPGFKNLAGTKSAKTNPAAVRRIVSGFIAVVLAVVTVAGIGLKLKSIREAARHPPHTLMFTPLDP
jgi:hypothetical protein